MLWCHRKLRVIGRNTERHAGDGPQSLMLSLLLLLLLTLPQKTYLEAVNYAKSPLRKRTSVCLALPPRVFFNLHLRILI
jgi:hypothetical protein